MERKKQITATVLSLSKEVKPASMAVPKFKEPFPETTSGYHTLHFNDDPFCACLSAYCYGYKA